MNNITVDNARQAIASISGYVYQFQYALYKWCLLEEGQSLFIECADDIDIRQQNHVTTYQIKNIAKKLSLRSRDVGKTISNHLQLTLNNPIYKITSLLITTGEFSVEKGDPFGAHTPGLEYWNACHCESDCIKQVIDVLKQNSYITKSLKDFLNNETFEIIHKKLISRIRWLCKANNSENLECKIKDLLLSISSRFQSYPSDIENLYPILLFKTIKHTLSKNEGLTHYKLLELLELSLSIRVPINFVRRRLDCPQTTQQSIINLFDSDVVITEETLICNTPQVPESAFKREAILQRIDSALHNDRIVVLYGAVGIGKTLIANQYCNMHSSSITWKKVHIQDTNAINCIRIIDNLISITNSTNTHYGFILDGFTDQEGVIRYYDAIADALRKLQSVDSKLIITCHHKFPNCIEDVLADNLEHIEVGRLTASEINEYLIQSGCPDGMLESWASIIYMRTSGHPWLIRAYINHLIQIKWRNPEFEDLISEPIKIKDTRYEARRLASILSEDQRSLLYRLCVFNKKFKLAHVLRIAEVPPIIACSSDVFTSLIGVWVDQIEEDVFSYNPLFQTNIDEYFSPDIAKLLYKESAKGILHQKVISPSDATSAILNSIRGQADAELIQILISIISCKEEYRKDTYQVLVWFLDIEMNTLKDNISDPIAHILVRTAQYLIAFEHGSERCLGIAEGWFEEIGMLSNNHPMKSIMHMQFIAHIISYNMINISIETQLKYFQLAIPPSDGTAFREKLLSDYEIFEENNSVGFLEFYFQGIILRINTAEDLLEFTIHILGSTSNIKELAASTFNNNLPVARAIIDRIWMQNTSNTDIIQSICLKSLMKSYQVAVSIGSNAMINASLRGWLISMALIDKKQIGIEKVRTLEVKEDESYYMLLAAYASCSFEDKDYVKAFSYCEQVITHLKKYQIFDDYIFINCLWRAGVCSGKLGEHSKSAEFFYEGYLRATDIDQVWAIGFLADTGYARWMQKSFTESIMMFATAIEMLNTVEIENQSSDSTFTVKKLIGQQLLEIEASFTGQTLLDGHNNAIGVSSNINADMRISDMPPTPLDLLWVLLATIDDFYQLDTEVFHKVRVILDSSDYPVARCKFDLMNLQRGLRTGQLSNLIVIRRKAITSFENTDRMGKLNLQAFDAINQEELSHIEATNRGNTDEMTIDLLLAAFVSAYLSGVQLDTLLVVWSQALEDDHDVNLKHDLELLNKMYCLDINELMRIFTDKLELVVKRKIACTCLFCNETTNIQQNFISSTFYFNYAVHTAWFSYYMDAFSDKISKYWLTVIENSRALLHNPRLLVPLIVKACKHESQGLEHIAGVFLAAEPATGMRLPSSVSGKFKKMCEGELF